MSTPLVSIIIPSFNRAELIGKTLESVLIQDYTNWECIIVDDGSTDNTMSVVQEYVDKDDRFQLHKRPPESPKGANACRNYGFELSKGAFINWLDSDDLFSRDKISSQITSVSNESYDRVVVTSKWNFFSDTIEGVEYKDLAIYKNYNNGFELIEDFGTTRSLFPPHCFLVSRKTVTHSGLWNEDLKINQDGEFFVRVLLCAQKVIHPENGMAFFRNHEGARISNYSSNIKIEHAILSWKLINNYLNIKEKRDTWEYIEYAKEYVFLRTRNQNPDYIKSNKDFFKNQIYDFSLKRKIKDKLYRILKFNK